MSFKITVNPGTVLSDLQGIASALQTGIKPALEAGGKAGLVEAQNKVPVRTGNLQRSLYAEVKENSLEIGGRANYTAYVEFGTSRGLPARPFIRPGADVALREIQTALPKGLGLQGGFGAIRSARP